MTSKSMSIKGKGDKCDNDRYRTASYTCCNHKILKFIHIQFIIILHINLDTSSSNKER